MFIAFSCRFSEGTRSCQDGGIARHFIGNVRGYIYCNHINCSLFQPRGATSHTDDTGQLSSQTAVHVRRYVRSHVRMFIRVQSPQYERRVTRANITVLKGNKFSLYVATTNCVLIATKPKHSYLKNRHVDLHLAIFNKELEVIQTNKYLGVVIDNSLNWKEHITAVSAKVSKAIGYLRHAKASLPQKALMTLYTSATLSILFLCLGLRWFNID